MPLHIERYDDVQRLRMSNLAGRAVSMNVSAFVVRGVMIDSGFPRVRAEVADAVRWLRPVGAIITHWHEDHAGNVPLLAHLGVPVSLRADTERTLRERPRIQMYRRVIWGHPPPLLAALTPFEEPDLMTVHTPGHSSDHQVVFDRQTGTLFSGDLWLGVRARVLHSGEDPYVIVESLRIAEGLAPDRMFDAHRGLVDTPRIALRAKVQWLSDTLGELERRITEGWTDREIVRRILGGEERAALVSRGQYARANLVKAARRHMGEPDRLGAIERR